MSQVLKEGKIEGCVPYTLRPLYSLLLCVKSMNHKGERQEQQRGKAGTTKGKGRNHKGTKSRRGTKKSATSLVLKTAALLC